MITLKELVNRQVFTGEEDWQLIAEWFRNNNMAVEGIKLVSKLAQDKIEDDDWKYSLLRGDLTMYCATENLIEQFGVKNGCKLNSAITKWICCDRIGEKFEEVYSSLYEWVREFVSTQKQPFIFWQPFLKYINEKGIYFKDQKKEEKNDL